MSIKTDRWITIAANPNSVWEVTQNVKSYSRWVGCILSVKSASFPHSDQFNIYLAHDTIKKMRVPSPKSSDELVMYYSGGLLLCSVRHTFKVKQGAEKGTSHVLASVERKGFIASHKCDEEIHKRFCVDFITDLKKEVEGQELQKKRQEKERSEKERDSSWMDFSFLEFAWWALGLIFAWITGLLSFIWGLLFGWI